MSKSFDITTRGVVINRGGVSEGSARVFFYTEHLGLVGALAKSAREERSKLRAHLQLGSFGLYTIVHGRTDWRVTGASETKNTHFVLSGKPGQQGAAARLFGMMRLLVHGEEENAQLFEALWAFIHALPNLTEREAKVAEYLAMLRILAALGYVSPHASIPHLSGSSYSQNVLEETVRHTSKMVKAINEALFVSNLT